MTALEKALAELVGAPVTGMERLSGGASRETWAFVSDGQELILRRDPPSRPGPPGAMAREAHVLRAAHEAGLAVPEVMALDDGSRLGTPGLVMRRVAGEVVARRILRDPEYATARSRLIGDLGRFLAGLHALDPETIPGLPPGDTTTEFRARYLDIGVPSPVFELAHRWLDEHRPPTAEPAVVHGDFRLGNLLVGPDGLTAVLDWEFVQLGDPLQDLAWLCLKAWRYGAAPPVAGLGRLEKLFEAYEAASGRVVDHDRFHWWLVEKTLQWGVGCFGQATAHLSGKSPSVELAAVGRRSAEQEWDLLELLAPELTARIAAEPVGHDLPPDPVDVPGSYPATGDLLEAAIQALAGPVRDATAGSVRHEVRVVSHVLAIVQRELADRSRTTERYREDLRRLGYADIPALVAAIRSGAAGLGDTGLMEVLARGVRDRLAIVSPKHLPS